jgi:hypothetical protein
MAHPSRNACGASAVSLEGLSADPLEAEQRDIGVSFFWLLFLDKQEK